MKATPRARAPRPKSNAKRAVENLLRGIEAHASDPEVLCRDPSAKELLELIERVRSALAAGDAEEAVLWTTFLMSAMQDSIYHLFWAKALTESTERDKANAKAREKWALMQAEHDRMHIEDPKMPWAKIEERLTKKHKVSSKTVRRHVKSPIKPTRPPKRKDS